MTRQEILDEAKNQVSEINNEKMVYEFAMIAALWSGYLGMQITAKDASLMIALLKIADAKSESKKSNYIDLVRYGACAGEIDGVMFNEYIKFRSTLKDEKIL